MLQIIVHDLVLNRVVWDSVEDGHFDEKFKTLPAMIQDIFRAWEDKCFSRHETCGEFHRDGLSFTFGGFNYSFFDLYWD